MILRAAGERLALTRGPVCRFAATLAHPTTGGHSLGLISFRRKQGHHKACWYVHLVAYIGPVSFRVSRWRTNRDDYLIAIEWRENDEGFGNPSFQWAFHR